MNSKLRKEEGEILAQTTDYDRDEYSDYDITRSSRGVQAFLKDPDEMRKYLRKKKIKKPKTKRCRCKK